MRMYYAGLNFTIHRLWKQRRNSLCHVLQQLQSIRRAGDQCQRKSNIIDSTATSTDQADHVHQRCGEFHACIYAHFSRVSRVDPKYIKLSPLH